MSDSEIHIMNMPDQRETMWFIEHNWFTMRTKHLMKDYKLNHHADRDREYTIKKDWIPASATLMKKDTNAASDNITLQ